MPVARIYASLVEEAEPICADLLARGYNVEVVFPDAVLSTPADLELRVERCSAEQAIARVGQGGSSSRCVFVTPVKGPSRDLLLVEMTVLATGSEARHPMAVPAMALVAGHLAGDFAQTGKTPVLVTDLASILPFPAVAPVAATPVAPVIVAPVTAAQVPASPVQTATPAITLPVEALSSESPVSNLESGGISQLKVVEIAADSAAEVDVPVLPIVAPTAQALEVVKAEHPANAKKLEEVRDPASRRRSSDVDLSKDLIAELNAFLAHAPLAEGPEGLHVRIFDNVRHSAGAERARKNWEGLTMGGVAAGLLLLVSLGWYAGPRRNQQASAASPEAVQTTDKRVTSRSAENSANHLRLASETHRIDDSAVPQGTNRRETLIAKDHVIRIAPLSAKNFLASSVAKPKQAPTTTSVLIPPAGVRPSPSQTHPPVKIITDLK